MRNNGPHRDLSPTHPAGKQPQWDSNPQPSARSPHPSFQVACLCLKLVPKLETTGDTRTQGLLFKGSFFFSLGWGAGVHSPGQPPTLHPPASAERRTARHTSTLKDHIISCVLKVCFCEGLWPLRPCVLSGPHTHPGGSLEHTRTLSFPCDDAFSKSHTCMNPSHQTRGHFSSQVFPHSPPQSVAIHSL